MPIAEIDDVIIRGVSDPFFLPPFKMWSQMSIESLHKVWHFRPLCLQLVKNWRYSALNIGKGKEVNDRIDSELLAVHLI